MNRLTLPSRADLKRIARDRRLTHVLIEVLLEHVAPDEHAWKHQEGPFYNSTSKVNYNIN